MAESLYSGVKRGHPELVTDSQARTEGSPSTGPGHANDEGKDKMSSKMSRGARRRARRQTLGLYGQVLRYVAAVSAGLWSEPVQMTQQRSRNSTIYARRLKYLNLALSGLRGPHAAELTAAAAVPWVNGAAVVHLNAISYARLY